MAELPDPVVGPMLSALAARTDSARSRPASEDPAPRPAFDPRILHYGVQCAERDVMTVSFSAPPGVRVSVNGIQPRPGREGSAAVPVTPTSDVAVTVAAPDGAYTIYTLHCMPPELWAIRTGPDPARPLGVLLAMARGPWAAVIDGHGVSRAHVRGEGNGAGFFLRPFGSGPGLRWAHAGPAGGGGFRVRSWTVARPDPRAVAHRLDGCAADHDGAARLPSAGGRLGTADDSRAVGARPERAGVPGPRGQALGRGRQDGGFGDPAPGPGRRGALDLELLEPAAAGGLRPALVPRQLGPRQLRPVDG